VPLDDSASRVVSLRSWSHFWSHPPAFGTVRGAPTATRHRRSGRWQPTLNANQQTWKACWWQRLASSNLASSAAPTRKNVRASPNVRAGSCACGLNCPARCGYQPCHRGRRHPHCRRPRARLSTWSAACQVVLDRVGSASNWRHMSLICPYRRYDIGDTLSDLPAESDEGPVAGPESEAGSHHRPARSWLGRLSTSIASFAGGMAVNDVSGTLGYHGLAGAVALSGVVTAAVSLVTTVRPFRCAM
jgi:hypothetical protein